MIAQLLTNLRTYRLWYAAIVPLIIAFLVFHPHYLVDDTFFRVCAITLPFSFLPARGDKRYPFFYLLLAVWLISMTIPTTIGIYCVLWLIIACLAQQASGHLSPVLLIHVLLASPLFKYFSTLISFPVRLHLSSVVATLLGRAGYPVAIEGNLVILGETEFLIDQACSGLHMLGYGLLSGTLVLAHFSRRHPIGTGRLAAYYVSLLVLIAVGNIARITLLIVFHILPEHWFHEGLGIIIYGTQVLLPFYLLVRFTLPAGGTPSLSPPVRAFPVKQYLLLALMFAVLIWRNQVRDTPMASPEMIRLTGYRPEVLKNGVVKLYKPDALLYLKPPVAPYRADHNPMICWQGSGYAFKKVEEILMRTFTLNVAELEKGKEKLYTAWWFESANSQTGNQWEWRKRALSRDEQFYLVNLTCGTRAELLKESSRLAGHIIKKQTPGRMDIAALPVVED